MWSKNISIYQTLASLLIIARFIPSLFASSLQYCHVDKSLKTDQCLAISTYHNTTSNANDFYLLISAKFEDRKGFAAFGTGTTMDGALIFVIYPGESERGIVYININSEFHIYNE